MLKKNFYLFAVILAFNAAVAQNKPTPVNPKDPINKAKTANTMPLDPAVVHGVLKNGMHYYILRNSKPEHRAELRLAVNAGSTQEDDDQQGYAHLIEHMAFNGTLHYAHNDLVNYLESIGTKFGPDLNAYTSFDETVYMLQVPTDKDPAVSKGLEILSDWASGQLLDSTEIEKERGVVLEEWRLGQGAFERMRRQVWPVIYAHSRYAERLPIGKPDIIQHGSQYALRAFYQKWYRPELQAIIVVGDIDVKQVEKTLNALFEKSAPAPPENEQRHILPWPIESNKALNVKVASDKESPYNIITLTYRFPEFHTISTQDYRTALIYNLASRMLSGRLKEMTMGSTPSFIYAGADWGNSLRHVTEFTSTALVSSDKILDGAEKLVTENIRAARFGFTESEFMREKDALKTEMENKYNERKKTESRDLVDELVQYYLNEESFIGIEKENELFKTDIAGIQISEINAFIKKVVTNGENASLVAMCTEKEGIHLPGDGELRSTYDKAYFNKTLTAYAEKATNMPLVSQLLPAGKVLSTKEDAKNNIIKILLSNGAKVLLKPTSFKDDEILFNAVSPGGSSLYKDEIARDVETSVRLQDAMGYGTFDASTLDKMLRSKQISLDAAVTSNQEVFYGSSVTKDLETLFQLLYLRFTSPRYDEKDGLAFLAKQRDLLASTRNDPNSCFRDSVNWFIYAHNVRYQPTDMSDYMKMTPAQLYKYYKERFASPSDFTFTFVGNFKKEQIVPLLEKYLASISGSKKETYGTLPKPDPLGTGKIFIKGDEPRASVHLVFNGVFDYTREHRNQLNALMKVVNIKLRESLREDKSGVYGVGAYPVLQHFPDGLYQIHIVFSCAPDKVDILSEATLDEIRKIQKNGCDSINLVKVKETSIRERELQLKENRFWLSAISNSTIDGEDINDLSKYNTWVESMTGEPFKIWATMYFNESSLKRFVLMPEKK